MKNQVLFLALTATVFTQCVFSQEGVELSQDRVVVNGPNGAVTIYADGSQFGGSACPGFLVSDFTVSDGGATSMSFNGCVPVLRFGTLGLGGSLQITSASGGIGAFISSEPALIQAGQSGNAGVLELKDNDGLTTIQAVGEFGSLRLGSTSEDGDIQVLDNDPDQTSFGVDGATGNVTNQLDGNGLIKAWAKISSDGSIVSCWRCDSEPSVRSSTGIYDISFSALGTNIQGRPRMAVIDSHSVSVNVSGFVNLAGSGDFVTVATRDASGALADRPFTVFVY